jgi:hypothetical protein
MGVGLDERMQIANGASRLVGVRGPTARKVAPFNQGIGIATTGNFVFFGKDRKDGQLK